MPTLLRLGRGMVRYERAAAEPPAQPLRLWSYESNQFARLVRAPSPPCLLMGLVMTKRVSSKYFRCLIICTFWRPTTPAHHPALSESAFRAGTLARHALLAQ